jgi:hypothetical protein
MRNVLGLVIAVVTLAGCPSPPSTPDLGNMITCTQPSDCPSKECCVGIRNLGPGSDIVVTHCASAPAACPVFSTPETMSTLACSKASDCARLNGDAATPDVCDYSGDGLSICQPSTP